jgi:B9 domain-containing protein 2
VYQVCRTVVAIRHLTPSGIILLLLRRYLEWGKAWSLLAGDEASQTQYSEASDDGVQIWNHPIDVHFATASMQGWPRIIMQLCELDEYGRSILSGYGFTHLPTNPGETLRVDNRNVLGFAEIRNDSICSSLYAPGYHELEVHCWRPSGSVIEELNSIFLGTSPCLADERLIFGKAWETRSQLNTVSSGIVSVVPRECPAQVKWDSLLTLRCSTTYSTGKIECSHTASIFQ